MSIRWDTTTWPLVEVAVSTTVDGPAAVAFLRELDLLLARAVAQDDRLGLVLDTRRFDRDAQGRLGEWSASRSGMLTDRVRGVATVVDARAVPAMRRYRDAHPEVYPFPVEYAATVDECREWVRSR